MSRAPPIPGPTRRNEVDLLPMHTWVLPMDYGVTIPGTVRLRSLYWCVKSGFFNQQSLNVAIIFITLAKQPLIVY